MNKLDNFVAQIKISPEKTTFQDVIATIDRYYRYTPTSFTNGIDGDCVVNKAGENQGSCKIFSFAQKQQLDKTQTLHCFGQYFRDDVLNHPQNTDHSNIRRFMKYGWEGIRFDGLALMEKTDL